MCDGGLENHRDCLRQRILGGGFEQLHEAGAAQYATKGFPMSEKGKGSTAFSFLKEYAVSLQVC